MDLAGVIERKAGMSKWNLWECALWVSDHHHIPDESLTGLIDIVSSTKLTKASCWDEVWFMFKSNNTLKNCQKRISFDLKVIRKGFWRQWMKFERIFFVGPHESLWPLELKKSRSTGGDDGSDWKTSWDQQLMKSVRICFVGSASLHSEWSVYGIFLDRILPTEWILMVFTYRVETQKCNRLGYRRRLKTVLKEKWEVDSVSLKIRFWWDSLSGLSLQIQSSSRQKKSRT